MTILINEFGEEIDWFLAAAWFTVVDIADNDGFEELGMYEVFDEVNVQVDIGILTTDCQMLFASRLRRLVQAYSKSVQ